MKRKFIVTLCTVFLRQELDGKRKGVTDGDYVRTV